VAVMLAVAACNEDSVVMPSKDTPVMTNHGVLIRNSDDVAAIMNRELAAGASSEVIEAFFKNHDIGYSYDKFSARYQGISWVSKFHTITILIPVDDRKRMIRSEVHDSLTGL